MNGQLHSVFFVLYQELLGSQRALHEDMMIRYQQMDA